MANCTPIVLAVTDGNGNAQSAAIPPPYLSPIDINAAGGFPLSIVAATAGMIVRVYRMFLVVGGATTLTFDDGATALPGKIVVSEPNEVITLDQGLLPWYQTAIGDALNLASSANVQLTGAIWVNLNAT